MSGNKLKTPDWILEGFDSKEEYLKKKGKKSKSVKKKVKKGKKTFSIKVCPKCESKNVRVVVGEDAVGVWECCKCNYEGKDFEEKELNEKEMMEMLDAKMSESEDEHLGHNQEPTLIIGSRHEEEEEVKEEGK